MTELHCEYRNNGKIWTIGYGNRCEGSVQRAARFHAGQILTVTLAKSIVILRPASFAGRRTLQAHSELHRSFPSLRMTELHRESRNNEYLAAVTLSKAESSSPPLAPSASLDPPWDTTSREIPVSRPTLLTLPAL